MRRKFEEARKAKPSESNAEDHAKSALNDSRELYLIERAWWDTDRPRTAAHRVRVRAALSAPILERFHAWLLVLEPKGVPKSLLGKAAHYALGQWPKLTTFLTHGEVPLDNNRCENALRAFVIGRKGWLFSDTVKGAIARANLYSIVKTAQANGVEPHAYLSLLGERPPHAKTVEDFEALLPGNGKAAIAAGLLRCACPCKDAFP